MTPPPSRSRRRLLTGALFLLLGACAAPFVRERLRIWKEQRENRRIVREVAGELGLPPGLLESVAREESSFRTHARSRRGAVGVMQVLPSTGQEVAWKLRLEVWSLDDPRDNARIGGAYLQGLLARYGGDTSLALAAYNAGPGRVDAWIARGPGLKGAEVVERFAFPETRTYVREVLDGL